MHCNFGLRPYYSYPPKVINDLNDLNDPKDLIPLIDPSAPTPTGIKKNPKTPFTRKIGLKPKGRICDLNVVCNIKLRLYHTYISFSSSIHASITLHSGISTSFRS